MRALKFLSVGLLLGACAEAPAPEPQTEADAAAVPQAGVRVREVDVTLTEGTNLAVTVDPATNNRVVSLQGTLFLLPGDGGEARALTDAYYDAREPMFSADGSQVVFQGYRSGNWDLWRVAVSGGEPVAITRDAFDDREPQFSADGSRVVFSSDRAGQYDIWQVDVSGDNLTRLTDTGNNTYAPSWSASGDLAYVEQVGLRSRLMLASAGGGERMLSQQPGVMSGAQFAPDGEHVSYQVMGPRGPRLRLVELATGEDRALSAIGIDVFPFRAAWLDGGSLSYAANGKIFRRSIDASASAAPWPFSVSVTLERHDYARRQRSYSGETVNTALGINSPVIANGGEDIYFAALGDLWHWRPTDQALTKVTDDPAADYGPALSPDGSRLAYVSDKGGQVGLWVRDLAAGESERLSVQARTISVPSWAPDNEKLAFFVDVPGNPLGGQLTVLDVTSGETENVLEPMPAQPISWSPAGDRVAVTRLNPYSTRFREGVYELLVIDVASGNSSVITPDQHRSVLHAALTADGAMTYVQDGLLHRLELDDALQPLETAGVLVNELTDMPSWSADGEHLVYLSGNRLMRLERASGNASDVTPELFWRRDTPAESYVLRAGRVFPGTGDAYLENQDIYVSGNRIEKIVPHGDTGEHFVVDASDYTVVPGLFEMHAHMGETSEVQGRVWLSYGVTTVRDPGSNPYVAKERQEAWDSGRRVGPRTHVTGYLTDGNRVFYAMAEGIAAEAHLQMALERTAALELDFIKTYVRLPDHWQKTVVDFAHELGIPVSSHELYPAVAHGMDHVEHIGGTSRRGYQPKVSRAGYSYGDVVELLAASGMGLTATAVLPGFAVIAAEEPDWFETRQFEHFYGPETRQSYELMMPRFGAGASLYTEANGKLLRDLTERDALLVTGTDSPFVPYGGGLHAEFRLYDRAGVAPADILRQATYQSALACGVSDDLGTLEAGKLADMVIVDGDPLQEIRDLDNVRMTIKNGRRYTLDDLLVR